MTKQTKNKILAQYPIFESFLETNDIVEMASIRELGSALQSERNFCIFLNTLIEKRENLEDVLMGRLSLSELFAFFAWFKGFVDDNNYPDETKSEWLNLVVDAAAKEHSYFDMANMLLKEFDIRQTYVYCGKDDENQVLIYVAINSDEQDAIFNCSIEEILDNAEFIWGDE